MTKTLDRVAERILKVNDAAVQRSLARALRASIRVDLENNPPRIASATDVSNFSGISLQALLETGVIVSKKTGHEFLSSLDIATQSYERFKKTSTSSYFTEFFRRPPARLGRTFVFSYAEILHMTSTPLTLELPSALEPLLEKAADEPKSFPSAERSESKRDISLQITLDIEHKDFSEEHQESLLKALKELLGVDAVEIVDIRKGSTEVDLSIPADAAADLMWAVKSGRLDGVLQHIHRIDLERAAAAAILQEKRRQKEFDVFLCHNSVDKPEVKRVGEKLKDYGILPWLDEWELRPGFPWQRLLQQQMLGVRAAAVFVGSSGIGPWQDREIDAFIQQFVARDCPVIPVLLRSHQGNPELPPFLSSMSYINLRKRKPNPIEQLIWGITGRKFRE